MRNGLQTSRRFWPITVPLDRSNNPCPGCHLKKSLRRSESVPERVRPAFMGYSETIGICPEVPFMGDDTIERRVRNPVSGSGDY